ncbi:MAG: hypothetical protein M9962_09550 [Oligoflexia bacterium]|nr:hypothetical protein [Oligoflexia bacterium]
MRIHVVKIFCLLVFAPILSFADDVTIAVENTNISSTDDLSPESKVKNFFIGFGY